MLTISDSQYDINKAHENYTTSPAIEPKAYKAFFFYFLGFASLPAKIPPSIVNSIPVTPTEWVIKPHQKSVKHMIYRLLRFLAYQRKA